jgi:hypothetical protein
MRKVTVAGLVLPAERLDPPDVGATLRPARRRAGPQPRLRGQPLVGGRLGINDCCAAMIGDLDRRPEAWRSRGVVSRGWGATVPSEREPRP